MHTQKSHRATFFTLRWWNVRYVWSVLSICIPVQTKRLNSWKKRLLSVLCLRYFRHFVAHSTLYCVLWACGSGVTSSEWCYDCQVEAGDNLVIVIATTIVECEQDVIPNMEEKNTPAVFSLCVDLRIISVFTPDARFKDKLVQMSDRYWAVQLDPRHKERRLGLKAKIY